MSVPRRCFEPRKVGRIRVGARRAEEINERWSSLSVCKLAESLEGKCFGKETQCTLPTPPGALRCRADPVAGTGARCLRRRRRDASTAHALGSVPSAANAHCKGLLLPFTDIQLLESDLHCFEVTRSPANTCVSRNICTHD